MSDWPWQRLYSCFLWEDHKRTSEFDCSNDLRPPTSVTSLPTSSSSSSHQTQRHHNHHQHHIRPNVITIIISITSDPTSSQSSSSASHQTQRHHNHHQHQRLTTRHTVICLTWLMTICSNKFFHTQTHSSIASTWQNWTNLQPKF